MPVWTCPNLECTFDEQLKPKQCCPLCMREAKKFKFSEFGDLLKKKRDAKKSKESRNTSESRAELNSVRHVAQQKYSGLPGSPNYGRYWNVENVAIREH
jgi:hypothetical protein